MIKKPHLLSLLVVEDNPGDFLLLEEFLESSHLGFSIIHAENSKEVIEIVKANNFDIVLLDLSLPDSNGVDSVILINDILPKIPIIVFSGFSTIEIAIEAISHGAEDYLIKGEFNEKMLTKSIQYCIERKKTRIELSEQQLRQQKLITEISIQAQEKERNELGRELHDNINQLLATVKFYLGMAKSRGEDELIQKSYGYLNDAMAEIRKLSHTLVAPSLGDITLKDALLNLAAHNNSVNGLHIEFSDQTVNGFKLGHKKELALYRIVQEQLSNVIKHSKAKDVVITMKNNKDDLYLTVSDNGVGFDKKIKSQGIGLKNISNRAQLYSCAVSIVSAPGEGCTLEVKIPLDPSSRE